MQIERGTAISVFEFLNVVKIGENNYQINIFRTIFPVFIFDASKNGMHVKALLSINNVQNSKSMS